MDLRTPEEREADARKVADKIEARAEAVMKQTVREALAAGKGRREAMRAGARAMDRERRRGPAGLGTP